MAYTKGMNTDTVRELASQMDNAARELRSADAAIERIVTNLGREWQGPDYARFRGWWQNEHKARLQRMVDSIEGLARSAKYNADDQDKASGGGGSTAGQPVGSGNAPRDDLARTLPHPIDGPQPRAVSVMPQNRSKDEVQARYDAWAQTVEARFRDPNESQYQCTGWANFRWHELGHNEIIEGHGGAMAGNAGPTSGDPSLHAMASYGAGTKGSPGHVMIVEEVSGDGSRIRVSEMNVGDKNWEVATADEYRDTNWIERGADGVFRSRNGDPIRFAAFPG